MCAAERLAGWAGGGAEAPRRPGRIKARTTHAQWKRAVRARWKQTVGPESPTDLTNVSAKPVFKRAASRGSRRIQ